MTEIPISREQEAYLEALKAELDDEVPYGHVRVQDAVQYLIDHHREDGDLDIEVRDVAAEGRDGPGGTNDHGGDRQGSPDDAGGGADSDANDQGEGSEARSEDGGTAAGDGVGATDANAGAESEGNAGSGGSGSAGATTTESEGSVDDTVAALGNAGPGGSGGSGGSGSDTEASGEGSGTIGSAGGEMVDEMMNLMDAHEDVWEETDSSEGKYRVELPEGDTETVPTKDDVRALLFKHYR